MAQPSTEAVTNKNRYLTPFLSLEITAKVPAGAPAVNSSASSGEATLLKVRSAPPKL